MGVQQSRGWVHYAIHRPEPHIMLYRCGAAARRQPAHLHPGSHTCCFARARRPLNYQAPVPLQDSHAPNKA